MKRERKRLAAVCALALCAVSFAAVAEMPRSEWHNLVSDCAQNAQTLKTTIAQLSAADQSAFLAEVNDAISKMPGSDEVKGARFYAANRAAVTGAGKGNRAAVLAEVFATVPPEYLTDINERFASELFNRNANPSRTFTDAEFTALSKSTMDTVIERCQKEENSGVRETFAILMFLRASGGTPADLAETLVAQIPDAKTRELAANEWIKPAMGDGQEQSYDPMLGTAQAGDEPDHAIVLQLAGPNQLQVALLADLNAPTEAPANSAAGIGAGAFRSPGVVGTSAANSDQSDIGLNRIPRSYVQSKTAVGGNKDGAYRDSEDGNPYYTNSRGSMSGSGETGGGSVPGPGPYQGQIP